MEAGFANKRERIAGMSRLTHKIFDKLITELPHLKLTDKSVGPLLTAVAQYAKHIAQEKEEFVEASKVDQQTNLSGTVGVAAINLESQLQNQSEDTRRQLEEEWTALGDEIIRNLTGGK
jgi:hypothetical protein